MPGSSAPIPGSPAPIPGSEYGEREGRLGLMLFTVTEDNWTNQNDELVKTSRSTLIRY